jgi:hypothetical protein
VSDIDRLIRAIAFDRAYAVAENMACGSCGIPATRMLTTRCFVPHYCCDQCTVPEIVDTYELRSAPAVRRLMKVAQGE